MYRLAKVSTALSEKQELMINLKGAKSENRLQSYNLTSECLLSNYCRQSNTQLSVISTQKYLQNMKYSNSNT